MENYAYLLKITACMQENRIDFNQIGHKYKALLSFKHKRAYLSAKKHYTSSAHSVHQNDVINAF